MPAISNMMRPGFTGATQRSGAPLPLPMRVSAGFLVNGLSGKMRIHSLPPRLIKRVMATRDASIWRSVIQAFSSAFRPYSPNARLPPRQALPLRRPRCCFLYFTFFGINIAFCSFYRPKGRPLLRLPPSTTPASKGGLLQNQNARQPRSNDRHAFALWFLAPGTPRNVFALINPALHADHAVRRLRLGRPVVNVR